MNILSKFNRICFDYAGRLATNEHASSFVQDVRQMIEEHEASPAPDSWQGLPVTPVGEMCECVKWAVSEPPEGWELGDHHYDCPNYTGKAGEVTG